MDQILEIVGFISHCAEKTVAKGSQTLANPAVWQHVMCCFYLYIQILL